LLLGGNLDISELIARLIVLLVAMTIHEFAHNYVGWKMGDPTPAQTGRLTLNPFVHINWVGWIMFVLIGFGILGSAPINPYRMPRENRRWRWLAAVAAGPVSNLLLAVIFALIIRLIGLRTFLGLPEVVQLTLELMIQLNVLLFVFNLLPLFPIDGWQIVYALLPPDLAAWWQRHQMTSYYIFIGLILLSFFPIGGFNILGIVISQPTIAITTWLIGLAVG